MMKKFLAGLAVVFVIGLCANFFYLRRAVYRQCVEDLDQDNLGNTLHECDYLTYREIFFHQGKYRKWLKAKQQEKVDSDFLNEREL